MYFVSTPLALQLQYCTIWYSIVDSFIRNINLCNIEGPTSNTHYQLREALKVEKYKINGNIGPYFYGFPNRFEVFATGRVHLI